MAPPLPRLAAILTFLVGSAACAQPRPEVWFTPNLGSRDMLELFTQPRQWRGARASTDVFKFYQAQVLAERAQDCLPCGANLLPNFRQVDAFATLDDWGIHVALEVGAVKEWSCAAALSADLTLQALANVEAGGGTVRYLAMDEPLLGGEACDLGLNESAAQAAEFMRIVRARHPRLRIGDIEPYPRFLAPVLMGWLGALKSKGARPAFFHLDVDRARAERLGVDVSADLRALEAFCLVQGIPFGVIFWSAESSTDRAYYDDTLGWTRAVHGAIGVPGHSVFQSWALSPAGAREVPANLPEADPEAFSHTRLINDALATRP